MLLIKRNGNPAASFPGFFNNFITRDSWNKELENLSSTTNATIPAVNIRETNENFIVEMAAPGKQKNDFVIVQNNTTEMLTVSNPNLLNVRSVTLFDLTGKRIFEKEKFAIQEIYQFSTNGLSEAVYLVELLTVDNRKIGQKIMISNNKN